jgi:hypothetical protein
VEGKPWAAMLLESKIAKSKYEDTSLCVSMVTTSSFRYVPVCTVVKGKNF